MHREETKAEADKAESTGFGFTSKGQGMFEVMSKCCAGQGVFPDCSVMMKSMMDATRNKPCCTPKTEDTEFDGRKK